MAELSVTTLVTWAQAAYERAGMPPEDAAVVVDAQLEADRRGVDTHGFQRLPWYVDRMLAGDNNPTPALRIVESWEGGLVLDGDAGLGQLVCTRLMEHAVDHARSSGICVAVARRSNDWGCGARYPLMAAREGFVAFCTTTSVPTLAPYGTRTRMTGNNPMAFAPRRDAPPKRPNRCRDRPVHFSPAKSSSAGRTQHDRGGRSPSHPRSSPPCGTSPPASA